MNVVIPDNVRYIAWDDGESIRGCWGWSWVPRHTGRYWVATSGNHGDDLTVIRIPELDYLYPFDVWSERHLDLNVEADRLLFESLVNL